jgi:YesN/AraC family two-component response regulator
MGEQPKALQLAAMAHLGYRVGWQREAAAELRRLHEAHDWQHKMAGDRLRRIEKLEAVNQELLEALKEAALAIEYWGSYASKYFQEKHDLQGDVDAADYVISKAEAV